MKQEKKVIEQVTDKLRGILNESVLIKNYTYQKKDGSWDRLWAAMDALEDAQIAINNYRSQKKVSYLELYGLLQAFIVQQDSVNHIKQTLLGANLIIWRNEEPKLNDIRRIRNETVGHPSNIKNSKTGDPVFCNIDRSSITKSGFGYLIWSREGATKHAVNTKGIISTQEAEIFRLMNIIIDGVINIEDDHMKKFATEKLEDIYKKIDYYPFEKMYNCKNDPEWAYRMFKMLNKIYLQLRKKLEARYGDFSKTINVPGLQDSIRDLDELFNRIDSKFTVGIIDDFDNRIYIDALHFQWKELGTMIRETDERFS